MQQNNCFDSACSAHIRCIKPFLKPQLLCQYFITTLLYRYKDHLHIIFIYQHKREDNSFSRQKCCEIRVLGFLGYGNNHQVDDKNREVFKAQRVAKSLLVLTKQIRLISKVEIVNS